MTNEIEPASGIGADMVERYVQAQISHNRAAALAIVTEAVDAGVPLPEIYVNLIQSAQYELGTLWQQNQISIGQEHSGTAISELALTHLYAKLPRAANIGKTALIACVAGELHDLGARMVADAFEMNGYTVIYLGANVPTDTLVETILDTMPDIVGLSVTMSFNVTALFEVVRRVRASAGDRIEFLAGGSGQNWLVDAPGQLLMTAASGNAFKDVNHLSQQITGGPDELRLRALTDALTDHKKTLTLQVVADTYQHPFWMHRFGERGRKFAEEDGQHHITYLVQAIEVESSEILPNYARWLQNVLTQRGMCSRHIGENFEKLALAIEANNLPDASVAASYLYQAAQGLMYSTGPARDIQLHEETLTQQAIDQISNASIEQVAGVSTYDDVRYLISFLADAVQANSDQTFVDYIAWQCRYLDEQGLPRQIATDVLTMIDEAIEQVPATARTAPRRIIEAGRQAIEEAQPCSS